MLNRKRKTDGARNLTQPNILIVSDETTFAKVLANRWRSESIVPAFTVFGSDRNWHFAADAFDMAVVGGIGGANLRSLLMELSKADKPILVLVEDPLVRAAIGQDFAQCTVFQRLENWGDVLVAVGSEILSRRSAEARVQKAENERAKLEQEAALGRYVLDVRHSVNNALTSILGNAELLLLERSNLSSATVSQLETIRTMSLRIHETLQRLTSLEKEMNFSEGSTIGHPRQQAAAC